MHNAAQAHLDKLAVCFSECDEDLASWFEALADCAVTLATPAEVGTVGSFGIRNRAAARSRYAKSGEHVESGQWVVTPLALSQGCGLIALYTSPYLTPAG